MTDRTYIFTVRALLSTAILIALYLGISAVMRGHVSGCGEGASCSVVLQSKWSSVAGVPVGFAGAVLYAALFWLARRKEPGARTVREAGAWAVILGAAWFVIVQAQVLHAFCPWCCSAHACAALASGMLLLRPGGHRSRNQLWGARCAAAAAVAAMAAVQHVSPEPAGHVAGTLTAATVQSGTGGATVVGLHGGEFRFALDDYPHTGPVNAQHVLVALTDYACGHCRQMHGDLLKVLEERKDESLAILWLPGVRNDKSADIQRLMLSLWRSNPAVHAELEHLIFTGAIAAEPEAVKAAAARSLGFPAAVDAMIAANGARAHEQVYQAFRLFEKNGETAGKKLLPMLMAGTQVLVGAIKNPLIYHQVIEKEFGLKVPGPVQQALLAATAMQSHQVPRSAEPAAPVPPAVPAGSPALPEAEQAPAQGAKETAAQASGLFIPGCSRSGSELIFHTSHTVDLKSLPGFSLSDTERPAVLLIDFLSAPAREMAAELKRNPSRAGATSVSLLPAMPTAEAQMTHRALLVLWNEKPDSWVTVVDRILDGSIPPAGRAFPKRSMLPWAARRTSRKRPHGIRLRSRRSCSRGTESFWRMPAFWAVSGPCLRSSRAVSSSPAGCHRRKI